MPEITEETLVQRLCDPKQYEDALLETKTTLDTVAGSSIVHEAFRALHAAIAERDGQIAVLVEAGKAALRWMTHEQKDAFSNVCYERCAKCPVEKAFADPAKYAAARDERLKAEGAAEALRLLPCSCRAVGTNSEDAAVITCQRCFALSGYEAEAARLREEAGR